MRYAVLPYNVNTMILLASSLRRILSFRVTNQAGVQKHWWTAELTRIRNQSIDIHRLWLLEGKPRSGPTNDERLRVRATYRRAIKSAKKQPKQSCWNKLHETFAPKNATEFWKSWKKLYSHAKE